MPRPRKSTKGPNTRAATTSRARQPRDAVVAMVNNEVAQQIPNKNMETRGRRRVTEASNIAQNVSAMPKRPRIDRSSSARRVDPAPQYSPDSDEEETNANFQEGDRLIQMVVRAGDGDAQSEEEFEDDSDNEVTLRNSQQSADERDLAPEYREVRADRSRSRSQERRASMEAMDVEPLAQTERNGDNRRQQLKKLDLEVRQRINELRKLMSEGGMSTSANELELLEGQHNFENFNQNATAKKFKPSRRSEGSRISKSEDTIYKKAVSQRFSSSSEEGLDDTAGEFLDIHVGHTPNTNLNYVTAQFDEVDNQFGQSQNRAAEPQPSTSRAEPRQQRPEPPTPAEKADCLIKQAEGAKAKIFALPGNDLQNCNVLNSLMIDNGYMLVGAHVDEPTCAKIMDGLYVDFGKLIPRDRVEQDGEQKPFQLFQKGGQTYFAQPRSSVNISNIHKWDQAFRVYTNIYTQRHPQRASELMEYSHTIHTIAAAYVWENVYLYDIDFRMQMGRNPTRAWSVILQQSWNLRLKDRLTNRYEAQGGHHTPQNHNTQGNRAGNNLKTEPCRRFNRGKCGYGPSCRYEHRCSYCFKTGHSILNCRKLAADREKGVTPKQDTAVKRETI